MTVFAVDTAARRMVIDGDAVRCLIGRSGAVPAESKREGDGATPVGDWRIGGALLRPDRGLAPPGRLPWRWLRPDDGWSDDPGDAAYNRPVRHPHAFSAERLWRDDALYDIIIWLGHNATPPRPGAGSAIFLHLSMPERDHTEGCVAISRAAMKALLPSLAPGDVLAIR